MIDTLSFGLFTDDLPAEREAAESVLKGLLLSAAITPPAKLKQKILARLNFGGDALSLSDLPETDRYSNYLSWLNVLRPLFPKEPVTDMFMQEIRRDAQVVQTLVVTNADVPEETHEDYAESFFILEGRCACTIGGALFELSAGDYLDIPLHVPHDVRLLTPQVTAVLQYRFQ